MKTLSNSDLLIVTNAGNRHTVQVQHQQQEHSLRDRRTATTMLNKIQWHNMSSAYISVTNNEKTITVTGSNKELF